MFEAAARTVSLADADVIKALSILDVRVLAEVIASDSTAAVFSMIGADTALPSTNV